MNAAPSYQRVSAQICGKDFVLLSVKFFLCCEGFLGEVRFFLRILCALCGFSGLAFGFPITRSPDHGDHPISPVSRLSYNVVMARGWESKSVESQIDAAREDSSMNSKAPLTEAGKAVQRERANLLLARANVLRQIESSSNQRYVESRQQALKELDAKIARLPSTEAT